MGFFKSMSRIMQGKPVFDEDDGVTIHSSGMSAAPHVDSDVDEEHPGGIIKNNTSTFPVVRIDGFRADHNGSELEIRAGVKNDWHQAVLVQTVRAFNKQQPLGVSLQAGQSKEVVIYKGPTFPNQSSYEILLDYKTDYDGDYFQAIHDVKYGYNSYEKLYEVNDIRLRMPIRDIYG